MQSMGKHNLTLAISVAAFLLAPGLRAAQQTGTSALGALPNAVDRLTREVRHELVMQPYYGVFDDLSYAVSGSVVTLYGRVTTPALKSDAENAVKRIEGVTGRFNFLLTDGRVIAATAAGDTLFCRPAGGVVVASEPCDDEPGWTAGP